MTSLTDTLDDLLPQLETNGHIAFGGVDVHLETRATRRLVIGFLEAPDHGRWLTDICKDAAFSLLRIVAETPQALQQDALTELLKRLAGHPISHRADGVSLFGAGVGGVAALVHGQLFKDSVVVAFDPTLQDGDIGLVGPLAQDCHAVYVFHDPFQDARNNQRKALNGPRVHWLKCFAMQDASLQRLSRMKHLPTLLTAALRDELAPGLHYTLIRNRRDYQFYRVGMEDALAARGQKERIRRFRTLFRRHRQANQPDVQFDALRHFGERNRPDPLAAEDVNPSWPSVGGNIWMLENRGGTMRYLSDRWHGVTMGYEERSGTTLAQTPDVALGMLGLGHGMQVERPLARRFEWHVIDERLDGTLPAFGPPSEATLVCERRHLTHSGLNSILAISQSQAGITAVEAMRGGAPYEALLEQVRTGRDALENWGKTLFVDRLRLALLAGAPQTPEDEAAAHYAQVSQDLLQDLKQITDQSAPPFVVVVQGAGLRDNGASEVILAEGRFDTDNPALKALVPTPAYPWPLMPDTPATHSPEASLVMDELCVLAVSERQAGRPWHCPALQLAMASSRVVTAQFSSMAGLLLEDGAHGFRILGHEASPTVVEAEVISDTHVRLHLDAEVTSEGLSLAYAWGHEAREDVPDHAANHGALRDRWEQPSMALPGQTLKRYALSGRVPLRIEN